MSASRRVPALAAAALLAAPLPALAARSCDRACLLRIAAQFDSALVRHDARGLPVAGNLKATQNLQPLPLGRGVWLRATPIRAQMRVADPQSGQVATIGFFQLDGKGAYFISRLRVVDRKITESEFFFTHRGDTTYFVVDDPSSFDRYYDEIVPAAQRLPRAELMQLADENIDGGGEAGRLRRSAQVRGGENGFVITAELMKEGGVPHMPGGPIPGRVTMERDADDGSSPPPPSGAAGPNAGPGAGTGGGRPMNTQKMRERRHPLIDTERGLTLSYFIMGGRPPKAGEQIDWNKYYGQPTFNKGDAITIPNRSTYRIYLSKIVGGELTMNQTWEVEVPPHVVSGFRDAQTLGPE